MSEKYSFIDAEKARYPIVKMCVWLRVSTSGFYAWRDRPVRRPRAVGLGWPCTYLLTWQGFCYLATVIDCCTKECIGYAIADHMRAELVVDALRMAARNYQLQPEAIFTATTAPNISAKRSPRPPLGSMSVNP